MSDEPLKWGQPSDIAKGAGNPTGTTTDHLDMKGLLSEVSSAIRDTSEVSSEYLLLDNPEECAKAAMDVMRSAESGSGMRKGIIMGGEDPVITGNTFFGEKPIPNPLGPLTPQPMTADQQIRAKVLECVVRLGQSQGDWINFEDLLDKFERYIRGDK